MVNYTCDRCEKVFSDKTKFSLHTQRKNPCKKTTSALHYKDEEDEMINHIQSDMMINEKEGDGFSNYCRLCKSTYRHEGDKSNSLIQHLLDKHEMQKIEKTFRFSKKTSGLTLFENETEAGDIVLIGLPSGKGLLFVTTNLHNLQRHKKEKYRNMTSWTYYPCKNVNMFKMEWNHFISSGGDNAVKPIFEENEKEYPLEWLDSEITKIVLKINKQDHIEKTECLSKDSFYYECPYCNFFMDDYTMIHSHLATKHRFLKHDSLKFELNPDQEHQLIAVMTTPSIVSRDSGKTIIEDYDYMCKYCNMEFTSSFLLQKHMKEICRRSAFIENASSFKKAEYLMDQSLEESKISSDKNIGDLIEYNEKLKAENALLKEALISNQEMMKDQNEILKNSMSYVKTTNIIQNNNILFNVNDFGKEDLSHIQDEFVEEVIQEMSTNSLIKFIEEVHYANPRNCNVIIPPHQKDQQNTKLLLKKGDRWVMDDRKNVLDDMITINIERITDVYDEINVKLTEEVQANFQSYVSEADKALIRDEVILETESLIKRRQPSSKFLLENARVQQNHFIDGHWNKSVDTQLPMIKMDVGGMSETQIQDVLDAPPMKIMEKETPPILQRMQMMRNKKR